MKRFFIILSNILVATFFVWMFSIWSDTYVSYYYPNVSVFSSNEKQTFKVVNSELSRLADETDSTIAIQHQESGDEGKTVFSYTVFGKGNLPYGLTNKSREDASNSSVISNYFIFKGKLTTKQLGHKLNNLGFTSLHPNNPSPVTLFIAVFSQGFQSIVLMIFIMTFSSLSLISQIFQLRNSGVRLISGENRWKIFLRPMIEDSISVLIGLGVTCCITFLLRLFYPFPIEGFQTILVGSFAYNMVLLLISSFFAMIFVTGIKRVPIMNVIKGKIPIEGIICLILIGQLLAMLIVCIDLSRTTIYSQAWQLQEKGQDVWKAENNLTTLTLSRDGVDPRQSQEKIIENQKVWYNLIHQAVREDKGFLAHHFLTESAMKMDQNTNHFVSKREEKTDYIPGGNVLIVTPQYFQHQHKRINPEVEEKMKHLSPGEFIMLLPDTLRSNEEYYKTIFEEELSLNVSHQRMVARVSYIQTGKEWFAYNRTPIAYQQFLFDPIIIVVTPESTGSQSYEYWEKIVGQYFLFEKLSDTQSLIKDYGIEQWVSEQKSGYDIHKTLLQNLRQETWTMIAGAILGCMTSLLMFFTMSQLYFQEFRREILIKRISGLGFFEIHRSYLLCQSCVFLLGFLISLFFVSNLLISLLGMLLFLTFAIGQLLLQVRKENKMSLIVLKGA